jgi:hypothetical protein
LAIVGPSGNLSHWTVPSFLTSFCYLYFSWEHKQTSLQINLLKMCFRYWLLKWNIILVGFRLRKDESVECALGTSSWKQMGRNGAHQWRKSWSQHYVGVNNIHNIHNITKHSKTNSRMNIDRFPNNENRNELIMNQTFLCSLIWWSVKESRVMFLKKTF